MVNVWKNRNNWTIIELSGPRTGVDHPHVQHRRSEVLPVHQRTENPSNDTRPRIVRMISKLCIFTALKKVEHFVGLTQ